MVASCSSNGSVPVPVAPAVVAGASRAPDGAHADWLATSAAPPRAELCRK